MPLSKEISTVGTIEFDERGMKLRTVDGHDGLDGHEAHQMPDNHHGVEDEAVGLGHRGVPVDGQPCSSRIDRLLVGGDLEGARCLRTDRKQLTRSSASCRCSNELAAMKTTSNVRPRSKSLMSPCTHSTATPRSSALC